MPQDNRQRGAPLDLPRYQRGVGTGSHDVQDRYLDSKAAYTTPNPGYPFRKFAILPQWLQPFNTPHNTPKVVLKASYGHGYRAPSVAKASNKVVVIPNPVAPIAPTARGYESVEKAIRVGTFQAAMNAASVARRRRGQ